MPRTPGSQPRAQLLLLGVRYVGLVERLINPAGANAIGEGSERGRRADVAQPIGDEDGASLALSITGGNANHQGRSVLARAW
jgi:hypothetical protein